MKKITTLLLSCFILLLTDCDSTKSTNTTEPAATEGTASKEDKELTGTFTIGEKTYTGRVSTQNLEATGQFSVLCQDDTDPNDSKLLQFIFKDEGSARTEGYKTPEYDQGKEQDAKEAAVIYELNYTAVEESTGIVKINTNGSTDEIEFKDLKLKTMSKEEVILTGKIPF
jgi:hypothetical protein